MFEENGPKIVQDIAYQFSTLTKGNNSVLIRRKLQNTKLEENRPKNAQVGALKPIFKIHLGQ